MTRWFPIALLMTLAAAACSGASSSPSSPTTTETFNGTVNVLSSDVHDFTVSQSGTVNITLTAAAPPATISMGLGIGTPSGATCALISGDTTTAAAGAIAQLSGSFTAGAYCVAVYDVGNEITPVTYSVTVTHS